MSRMEVNQSTAKASLTQMLNVAFQRMEAGSEQVTRGSVMGPHSQGWKCFDRKPPRAVADAHSHACKVLKAPADRGKLWQTVTEIPCRPQGMTSCTEHLLKAMAAMLQVRVAPIAVNDVGGSGVDSSFVQSFLHDVSCCIMSFRWPGVLQLHGSCTLVEQESFASVSCPRCTACMCCLHVLPACALCR